MSSDAPPTATFTGSCHCGQVKYEATLPEVSHWQLARCNCTVCHKKGYLLLLGQVSNFKLVSPSSESELGDYTFGAGKIHHYFCKNCATGTHGARYADDATGPSNLINACTIDGVDLSKVKVGKYFDGREEKWKDGPCAEPVGPGYW